MRQAARGERLIDGGTHIRIKLKRDPRSEWGILYRHDGPISLGKVVAELAPAVDVDLAVVEEGTENIVVAANDWKTTTGEALLLRTGRPVDPDIDEDSPLMATVRARVAKNLRVLADENGTVFGRAYIGIGHSSESNEQEMSGVVCVGGLTACRLTGIGGLLIGEPMRASRDGARPIVPTSVLRRWAEGQADLVPDIWPDPADQAACAQHIRLCGGDTRKLPIATRKREWLSTEKVRDVAVRFDSIVIIDAGVARWQLRHLPTLEFEDNVIVVGSHMAAILFQPWHTEVWTWPYEGKRMDEHVYLSLSGAIVEAIASAWSVPYADIAGPLTRREKEVRIGTDRGTEIRVNGANIVRPG